MSKIINTSGKRKMAIARATVQAGKGRIRINSKPVELVEPSIAREKMLEPLRLLGEDRANSVDIIVRTEGGGVIGQADAARTAIARGLVEYYEDEELKSLYVEYDRSLLVNDPRRKEPKHPLGRGARSRRQKSYR